MACDAQNLKFIAGGPLIYVVCSLLNYWTIIEWQQRYLYDMNKIHLHQEIKENDQALKPLSI